MSFVPGPEGCMRACNNPDCNELVEDATLDRCPHCGHEDMRPTHPSSSSTADHPGVFMCSICGEMDAHASDSLLKMLQWLDSAPDHLNS